MTVKQRQNYDKVMTTEIDRMCEISYAKKQGVAEGKAEGKVEGKVEDARAMLADGMKESLVAKYTGLSLEKIAAL